MKAPTEQLEFFARCASGFEATLAGELRGLGAQRVRPLKGGVAFFGTVESAYLACLWSRVATRIQLVLARVAAADAETLYREVVTLPWEDHLAPQSTLAVRAHGENKQLRNTQFTALKVKDAVCDRLRKARGERPNVDAKNPGFALDVSVHKDKASLYLNLSGPSLHRRGYREDGVQTEAPLKETLAAGMLLAASSLEVIQGLVAGEAAVGEAVAGETTAGKTSTQEKRALPGYLFLDPLCGSGTLAIEAALMAADVAPGLLRTHWGFTGWAQHEQVTWQGLHEEATTRKAEGLARLAGNAQGKPLFLAGDVDARAIEIAQANAERAGVAELIEFHVADAAALLSSSADFAAIVASRGLLATNPPYGERLLEAGQLSGVYQALRQCIEQLPATWDLAIITPDEGIDAALGEVASQTIDCYNGPIETKLRFYQNRAARTQLHLISLAGRECSVPVFEAGSEQFAARLRKVAKERAKWARKEGVSCYRIYDTDLPDYALSVDLYQHAQTGECYARLAEYQAPASIDPLLADRRFQDAVAIVPAVLDLDSARVFSKVRKRAKGGQQYREARGEAFVLPVQESGYTFEVDLNSYLDTGLFLDHRITRELLGSLAGGKRVLNLFAYTGTATVHAAGGGAASTTTVDLSNTYLAWAKRNMELNGFTGPQHQFVRANVRDWLDQAIAQLEAGTPGQPAAQKQPVAQGQPAPHTHPFDLVFCDPPTFSNSKAMGEHSFEVQRDHVELLTKIKRLLAPGARVIFSCNLRNFKFDEEALAAAGLVVRDISPETIPADFARTPKIHYCFEIKLP